MQAKQVNVQTKSKKRRARKRKAAVVASIEAPRKKVVRSVATIAPRKTMHVKQQVGNRILPNGSRRSVPMVTPGRVMRFTLDHVQTSKDGSEIRVRGRDYVQNVQVSTAQNAIGKVVASLDISPGLFSNTRIEKFSQLYERWEMVRMTVQFHHVLATTFSGRIAMFMDYDVNDQPDATEIPLKILYGHQRSTSQDPFTDNSVSCYSSDDRNRLTNLYTTPNIDTFAPNDPNLKWYIPAKFWMVIDSPIMPFTDGMSLGDLCLSFDIRFFQPQLQASEGMTKATRQQTVPMSVPVSIPMVAAEAVASINSLPSVYGGEVPGGLGLGLTVPGMSVGELLEIDCYAVANTPDEQDPINSAFEIALKGAEIVFPTGTYWNSANDFLSTNYYRTFFLRILETNFAFLPFWVINDVALISQDIYTRMEIYKLTQHDYQYLLAQSKIPKPIPKLSASSRKIETLCDPDIIKSAESRVSQLTPLTNKNL